MHLERFIQTPAGRIFMSVILGVGLATLFKVSCKDKNCLIMRAPPLDQLNDKVYKIEDKCYKFNPTPVKCAVDNNSEIYEFA